MKTRGAYIDVARSDPERAAAIQPGKYALLKGMTAVEAFAVLADPANFGSRQERRRRALGERDVRGPVEGHRDPRRGARRRRQGSRGDRPPGRGRGQRRGLARASTYEFPEGATAADSLPPW